MPWVEPQEPEDFREVLRRKAHNHSLFYLKLSSSAGAAGAKRETSAWRNPGGDGSVAARAPTTARARSQVSELVRQFEPAPMQYLRLPRPSTPPEDIMSSDDDDRAAVRRRSRDLSDDSAIELEPRARRHSHPRELTPPPDTDTAPSRDRTLLEAHVVELGRRSSEGCEVRGRCVRTPSVVVSDYCDGSTVGATREELDWLRAKSLSADSACSSCSTLSSRDEDFDPPTVKKMIVAD